MILLTALLNLALLTSGAYPESQKEDELLIEALREYKVIAQSVDWHAPDIVWTDFDAVLVYSSWDYHEHYSKFLDLLKKIEGQGIKIYNSPAIIQWNSSKQYLKDLEKLGLKTIESRIFLRLNWTT